VPQGGRALPPSGHPAPRGGRGPARPCPAGRPRAYHGACWPFYGGHVSAGGTALVGQGPPPARSASRARRMTRQAAGGTRAVGRQGHHMSTGRRPVRRDGDEEPTGWGACLDSRPVSSGGRGVAPTERPAHSDALEKRFRTRFEGRDTCRPFFVHPTPFDRSTGFLGAFLSLFCNLPVLQIPLVRREPSDIPPEPTPSE
jgi:hypothetical protein